MKLLLLHDKVAAECDFEVEEIIKTNYDRIITGKETTMEDLLKNSCLTYDELDDYLKPDWKNTDMFMHCGYAIHIKKIYTFKEPKDLDYYVKDNGVTIKKAPQNMMYACSYDFPVRDEFWGSWKREKYILISVKSKELNRILNGEQSIIVRKKVLKGMISND